MSNTTAGFIRILTRLVRRHLAGAHQRWVFESPPPDWSPPNIESTSLYLHVPFCIYFCPYCPYTKVPYQESLIEPYTQAAIAEIDWWANKVGRINLSSIYIGGGTPTLALQSVTRILNHVQKRFNLAGDICIETNPADVTQEKVRQLHDANVSLVSLGIQSFNKKNLNLLGRRYSPVQAERALTLLVESGFSSVNADLMFALPGQTIESLIRDLEHTTQLGANQLTTYPLFTFPYSEVGKYMQLSSIKMPNLKVRKAHYHAINNWCSDHDYQQISVWGFKKGDVPRYSSVTRQSYIGIGPGAGSYLPDGFILNTFDLDSWLSKNARNESAIALRMPFTELLSGWWWLYWRLYETRVPIKDLGACLGKSAQKARVLLNALEYMHFAVRHDGVIELTEPGAFWVHLAQNHFSLNYVNTLWTKARLKPWPESISV